MYMGSVGADSISARGGVKTPPYGAKDTWAVMARWRAGHARPLQGCNSPGRDDLFAGDA